MKLTFAIIPIFLQSRKQKYKHHIPTLVRIVFLDSPFVEMSEQLKTYRGNCHCAEYVFEVQVPESSKPKECNCSLCYKRGALWLSPKSENLHFVKGDPSTLANYTFGGKTWNHKVCAHCVYCVNCKEPVDVQGFFCWREREIVLFQMWSWTHGRGTYYTPAARGTKGASNRSQCRWPLSASMTGEGLTKL